MKTKLLITYLLAIVSGESITITRDNVWCSIRGGFHCSNGITRDINGAFRNGYIQTGDSIVSDTYGNIYVSSSSSGVGVIYKLNATYHVSTFFSGPRSLSVTAADIYGFLYFYSPNRDENGRNGLFKINSEGSYEKVNIPIDAIQTVDKFGNVYFSHYQAGEPNRVIFKYDTAFTNSTNSTQLYAGGLGREYQWQDGKSDVASFTYISKMYADTTGNLWIVDSLDNPWYAALYGNISSSTYSLKTGYYIRKISTNGFVATVGPVEPYVTDIVENYSDVFFGSGTEIRKIEKTITPALGDSVDSKIYSAEVIELKDSIFQLETKANSELKRSEQNASNQMADVKNQLFSVNRTLAEAKFSNNVQLANIRDKMSTFATRQASTSNEMKSLADSQKKLRKEVELLRTESAVWVELKNSMIQWQNNVKNIMTILQTENSFLMETVKQLETEVKELKQ